MSRYIDASVLLRALAEMWYDSQISVTGISVSELINKQPSIDIVRCAECIWRDQDNQGEAYCTYVKGLADINEDSFCSWGKEK